MPDRLGTDYEVVEVAGMTDEDPQKQAPDSFVDNRELGHWSRTFEVPEKPTDEVSKSHERVKLSWWNRFLQDIMGGPEEHPNWIKNPWCLNCGASKKGSNYKFCSRPCSESVFYLYVEQGGGQLADRLMLIRLLQAPPFTPITPAEIKRRHDKEFAEEIAQAKADTEAFYKESGIKEPLWEISDDDLEEEEEDPTVITPAEAKRQYDQHIRTCIVHCAKCDAGSDIADLELDHIVALVNGGFDGLANWQLLCPRCHKRKTKQDIRIRDLRRKGVAMDPTAVADQVTLGAFVEDLPEQDPSELKRNYESGISWGQEMRERDRQRKAQKRMTNYAEPDEETN